MANINEEFLKDVEEEKVFLKTLVTAEVGEIQDNYTGVTNELALMVKTYNEVLEGLVKLRFDLDIYNHLILAEPEDTTHTDNKAKTEKALKHRRYMVKVIRNQISDILKELEKGKKDAK